MHHRCAVSSFNELSVLCCVMRARSACPQSAEVSFPSPLECEEGTHGENCAQTCSCANGGRCDAVARRCVCVCVRPVGRGSSVSQLTSHPRCRLMAHWLLSHSFSICIEILLLFVGCQLSLSSFPHQQNKKDHILLETLNSMAQSTWCL